jgi:hypothetical protein
VQGFAPADPDVEANTASIVGFIQFWLKPDDAEVMLV